jgi:hypothetical protein
MRDYMPMKSLMVTVMLLWAVCLQQAPATGINDIKGQAVSVSELKEKSIAPRYFTVSAYVIEKYDECPPCPAGAVCETCVFGIYVADENRPRKPGVAMKDGIYLQTNRAQEFHVGSKYVLKVRYRLEKNAAGTWLQTGPELMDFAPAGPPKNREQP